MDRGAEDSGVVAHVAAEEGKRVGASGCPGKTAQVSHGVTGAVEEVEGAVSEEVVGWEGADLNC